jgi:hypothetical protein
MRLLIGGFSCGCLSACIVLSGCGDAATKTQPNGPAAKTSGETGRNVTPQATLDAAKAAAEKRNFPALSQLLTPEAREEMAAGLVMLSGFLRVAGPLAKEGEGKSASQLGEKLGEVLEKHGVNEKTSPKITINLDASPEAQSAEMRKLAAPIKDHAAFVADVLGVLQKYGDKPDARLIEADARLKDVKIDGDTATATFVQTRGGKESSGPIAFQKQDGEWKISKVPPLMK